MYICLEVETAHAITKSLQDLYHQYRSRVHNTKIRTPQGAWSSQGSEQEVDEASVTSTRDKVLIFWLCALIFALTHIYSFRLTLFFTSFVETDQRGMDRGSRKTSRQSTPHGREPWRHYRRIRPTGSQCGWVFSTYSVEDARHRCTGWCARTRYNTSRIFHTFFLLLLLRGNALRAYILPRITRELFSSSSVVIVCFVRVRSN